MGLYDELGKLGFSLCHPDDHVVFLMHKGKQVAIFSQTGATRESILAECANHLALGQLSVPHRNLSTSD